MLKVVLEPACPWLCSSTNWHCLCLQESLESLKGRTQMGRPGQPCECGTCYVFLASEDGSYISGQTLHPNGGDVLNT